MNAEAMVGPAQGNELATILLVEDDTSLRRSLQLLLQARGNLVRSFASGTSLLADPNAPRAALLVADYQLPEIDGIAILQRLQQADWHGHAVLITGYNNPDLSVRARTAGFDEVIEKPFLAHTLLGTVARLLQSSPTQSRSQ